MNERSGLGGRNDTSCCVYNQVRRELDDGCDVLWHDIGVSRTSLKPANPSKKPGEPQVAKQVGALLGSAREVVRWSKQARAQHKPGHEFPDIDQRAAKLRADTERECHRITSGIAAGGSKPPTKLDRDALGQAVREIESLQQEIRNERELARTQFGEHEARTNQYYKLISAVLGTLNDTHSSLVRKLGS